MFRKFRFPLIFFIAIMTLIACGPKPGTFTPESPLPDMANPASTYCIEQGYQSEIRTAADGSQSGVCIFPDGSECDEWAYMRGECGPEILPATEQTEPISTEIPTAIPIDPAEYAGWWTYTHPLYGFSLQLPSDWIVDESAAGDALLNGHLLTLHPQTDTDNPLIRMTFRALGEDTLLWPTGVGAGELVQQGTLDVAGQPTRRVLFICPTGQVQSIYYQGQDVPNIQRGDTEFAFILTLTGHYCEEGFSLDGKLQHIGEMVIASLSMP